MSDRDEILEGLRDELASALDCGDVDWSTAAAFSGPADPFTVDDIASIDRYAVTSNYGDWTPGVEIGSELDLLILGQLRDGRWFSLSAGNDYTGWGCMGDSCDVKIAATEAEVIRQGLTTSERTRLGIELEQDRS